MESTSPRVKLRVMAMTKPSRALKPKADSMARGRVVEASLTSSDMWTAQSKPMSERTGESRPTMKAVPELFQPPPLVKEVKTWWAGAVGARTQRTDEVELVVESR
jgi:hypothetical protein